MAVGWREDRWRLIPGLAAVALAATPVVVVVAARPSLSGSAVFIGWWACVGAFVAMLLVAAWWGRDRRVLIIGVAAQTLLGLCANWLIPMAIEGVALTGILLVVAAGGLAPLSKRVAVPWMLAQTLGLLAIYMWYWPWMIALAAGGAYGAMQMVVYSATALAASEREKRVALESTLRELLSTREMLEETVRSSERSELARDLHDVMGHHLVALGLQLDAASCGGAPSEHLADARRLVRLLLADVREVVADIRRSGGVDLRGSLMRLASEGPGPRVMVEVDEGTPPMPSALAQTLLRCAQEALTNARKHAAAREVRIAIDGQRLRVSDDGDGMAPAGGGVGLAVMRERCASAGCEMRIESTPHVGTTVVVEFAGSTTS